VGARNNLKLDKIGGEMSAKAKLNHFESQQANKLKF